MQLSKGFVAGVKLAAPATVILTANPITGLIGRTLHRRTFVVGLNLNV